jgi:hypothetical protein
LSNRGSSGASEPALPGQTHGRANARPVRQKIRRFPHWPSGRSNRMRLLVGSRPRVPVLWRYIEREWSRSHSGAAVQINVGSGKLRTRPLRHTAFGSSHMTVPDRSALACFFTFTLRNLGTEKVVETIVAHAAIVAADVQAFSIMALDLRNGPLPSATVARTVSMRKDAWPFVVTSYHPRVTSLLSW